MAEQVPSIGRVVHYVYKGQHCAAVITDPAYLVYNVEEAPIAKVALTVFFPMEPLPMVAVADYSADPVPGTWHWPEYVPAKE